MTELTQEIIELILVKEFDFPADTTFTNLTLTQAVDHRGASLLMVQGAVRDTFVGDCFTLYLPTDKLTQYINQG